MRIAPNDPAGAHAVIGGQLQVGTRAVKDILWDLADASIRTGRQILEKNFPGSILGEYVQHETGSRAFATWLILEPACEDHLRLMELVYDVRRRHGKDIPWNGRYLGIRVSKHTLARVAQRTVHRGNLSHVVPAIHAHVDYALYISLREYQVPGTEFQTVNADGAILWRSEESEEGVALVACTWLDGESLKDPEIKRLVHESNALHGGVLCRRGKLNRPEGNSE